MTSFSQLCQDVITKTNRPELVDEVQLAVRQATKFLHMSNFWMRDCEEKLITFPVVSYTFQIDVTTLERYRKLRFIKKFDLTTQLTREGEENKLKEGSPTDLFDRFGSQKTNIYYIAGDNLNVKSNSQEQAFILSWYKYPDTAPESYRSWIAEAYDNAIVNKAAAQVFRDIGMTEDSNRLEEWVVKVDIPIVTMNDIEATAR